MRSSALTRLCACGLGGLGLEAVDELLQVGDLVLLLGEGGLLQRQLLGAQFFESAVVAAVAREPAGVDVQRDAVTASRNSRSWLMTISVPG
jgi:hypothetical protein